MKKYLVLLIALISFSISMAFGQSTNYKKHFIGSDFFMLANFASDSPEYYRLNYGYRISSKDVILVETMTWKYSAPLGIPYGSDKENAKNDFPGKVKAYGIGFSYKHFLYKGAYAQIHTTAFKQDYLDKKNKKIQSGFQMFNTLRFGYQFKFFKNQFFIEPSIAFTYWPINTNLPQSFQIEEDKWHNYFLFEPGLHFGINF